MGLAVRRGAAQRYARELYASLTFTYVEESEWMGRPEVEGVEYWETTAVNVASAATEVVVVGTQWEVKETRGLHAG